MLTQFELSIVVLLLQISCPMIIQCIDDTLCIILSSSNYVTLVCSHLITYTRESTLKS
nr:MAG TPA: hypothetical protein [Caudoviricetes sp.]